MKRIGVDIDGILVEEGPGCDRAYAKPLNTERDGLVEQVNRAYDFGRMVTIFTARPWSDYRMTVDQLKRLGVRYTNLVMGKPPFDIMIDDRATSDPAALKKFLDENPP